MNGANESGHLLTLLLKGTERGEFAITGTLAYRYSARDSLAPRV